MKEVEVDLVFHDWMKEGRSVYETPEGVRLSAHDFHGGTVFRGSLLLDEDDAEELRAAMKEGYQPVLWLTAAGK
jgi:hypothetical protein